MILAITSELDRFASIITKLIEIAQFYWQWLHMINTSYLFFLDYPANYPSTKYKEEKKNTQVCCSNKKNTIKASIGPWVRRVHEWKRVVSLWSEHESVRASMSPRERAQVHEQVPSKRAQVRQPFHESEVVQKTWWEWAFHWRGSNHGRMCMSMIPRKRNQNLDPEKKNIKLKKWISRLMWFKMDMYLSCSFSHHKSFSNN